MDQKAAELLLKGYGREKLSKDDCRYLLSFQEFSPEAIFSRDLFNRFFDTSKKFLQDTEKPPFVFLDGFGGLSFWLFLCALEYLELLTIRGFAH